MVNSELDNIGCGNLPPTLFQNTTALETLKLQRNGIDYLDAQLFRQLGALRDLCVDGKY